MEIEPIYIAGAWQKSNHTGVFQAVDPKTAQAFGAFFPISSRQDLDLAIAAGAVAAELLETVPPEQIADFLEFYAAGIEDALPEIADIAALETGLARDGRFMSAEGPRTILQLRQAAKAARDRSWTLPVLDTKLGLRALFAPISAPVAVFGPNNFPLAFNAVSGGDFAAAIVARNPVIAKGHPAHPNTTTALAKTAQVALEKAGLPQATLQLLYAVPNEDGLYLVSHPKVGATAFTGSRAAGMKLKAAADQVGKAIYLEMSGVNPVFLLPEAIQSRGTLIAQELAASVTVGCGQFCTNPGLVFVLEAENADTFGTLLHGALAATTPGVMLTSVTREHLLGSLEALKEAGASCLLGGKPSQDAGFGFPATLLSVNGKTFLEHAAALQTEAFGPVTLLVNVKNQSELLEIAKTLEGGLTASIYADETDETLYQKLEPQIRKRVGRLLNNKVPTGVALSPAMMHGGPYPSTAHPGFSAVGLPGSARRFASWQSYDNVPDQHLPEELKNANEKQVWRCVDGVWTNQALVATR